MKTWCRLSVIGLALVAISAEAGFVIRYHTVADLEIDIVNGPAGSSPAGLTVYDGDLYFAADGDGAGRELWRYRNGAAARLSDISPGADDGSPSELTVFDGALYFQGKDSFLNGELWKYDGQNVTLAAEIRPGSTGSFPDELVVFDNALYFNANAGNGYHLWRFDGASATEASALSDPHALTVHNGQLYFFARDGSTSAIWRFDGQNAVKITDVHAINTIDSFNSRLFSGGGTLYASAYVDGEGFEPRRVTGNSLELIADIFPGSDSSNPKNFAWFESKLYFAANYVALIDQSVGVVYGVELLRLGANGVELVADIAPYGSDSSSPRHLTPYGGSLYFSADFSLEGFTQPPLTGREVFRHNGGDHESELHVDIWPGYEDSNPVGFTPYKGGLCYGADDGVHGRELWCSTRVIADISVFLYPKFTLPDPGPYRWELEIQGEQLFNAISVALVAFDASGTFVLMDLQDVDQGRIEGGRDVRRISTGRPRGGKVELVGLAAAIYDSASGRYLGIETSITSDRKSDDDPLHRRLTERVTRLMSQQDLRSIRALDKGALIEIPRFDPGFSTLRD